MLEAQLSYGLIMLGNEKKNATGLLAAQSLSQAVPGWIRKAHESDGCCKRSRHFLGIARCLSSRVQCHLAVAYRSYLTRHFNTSGGKLNESKSIFFVSVGMTEEMYLFAICKCQFMIV